MALHFIAKGISNYWATDDKNINKFDTLGGGEMIYMDDNNLLNNIEFIGYINTNEHDDLGLKLEGIDDDCSLVTKNKMLNKDKLVSVD